MAAERTSISIGDYYSNQDRSGNTVPPASSGPPTTATAAPTTITIGGTQGHVEEEITGDLLVLWKVPFCHWKPIRNCTGRYSSCREKGKRNNATTTALIAELESAIIPFNLSPLELMHHAASTSVGESVHQHQHQHYEYRVQEFEPAPGRSDRILVLPLDAAHKTGIITYVKQNLQERVDQSTPIVRYVHTLNASSGFQRKLQAVGIQLQ